MTQVEMVKQICKSKNISIHKLEMDCGFSNGYISQLKKGVFPTDRAVTIANYLNIPFDFITNTSIGFFPAETIIEVSKPKDLSERAKNLIQKLSVLSDKDLDDLEDYIKFLQQRNQ